MTTLKTAAAADLKSFLERIERLEEERRSFADDIRLVYAEAKAAGFDPKAIREMVKRRRKDPGVAEEEDSILETYMHAVGMIPESPLASAVSALAKDAMARDQVIDAFKALVPRHGEIIARVGGEPLRIWRDETGTAYAEIYVEPKAKPAEKSGRGLKGSATLLSMVPRAKPPADEPVDTDETEPVE